MRIAMGIEYDGSLFSGWQRQAHATGIQEVLERALSKVADHPVAVVCAGRTDAGVHASAQVVHFDSAAPRAMRAWMLGVTCNLPPEVCVTWAQPVAEDFHARFSAVGRQYRYIILNRTVRPSLLRQRVCWEHAPLDVARMAEASHCLIGVHDFSSFRAQACQAKHPQREVYSLDIRRHGEFIYLDIAANAFLHHMVRNIAGTLMAAGRGDQPVEWVQSVLEARDRTVGGITASAAGLYLVQVRYPERFGVPQIAQLPCLG
ncbi:MAG: tRNA pseudouridine(38-40) synthase TruA [Gammaproteobacteria bacterium]|nr:tRNA pseudouridine(38-40) synthase TruA [Gammaproteobacteria bacterium]